MSNPKHPKFIQILSHAGDLYALDVDGDIWRRSIIANGNTVWVRQIGRP